MCKVRSWYNKIHQIQKDKHFQKNRMRMPSLAARSGWLAMATREILETPSVWIKQLLWRAREHAQTRHRSCCRELFSSAMERKRSGEGGTAPVLQTDSNCHKKTIFYSIWRSTRILEARGYKILNELMEIFLKIVNLIPCTSIPRILMFYILCIVLLSFNYILLQ